jgi:hypothetical protein
MSRFHTTEFDLLPLRAFSGRAGRFGSRITLEGSKGSDVPAPDPRLVDAQIRSMDYQQGALERIISNAESFAPLQREQLQFGLDSARTAYDQSQADREWMLDRRGMLSSMQDDLVQQARDFNSEDRREQLAGTAASDVSQAFGLSRGIQGRELERRGVNPAQGAYAAMSMRSTTDEALARANAANKTREAARLEGFALTDRANNALAGYPAMGMQATGAGAGFGGMGLQLTNQGLAGMNSGFGAAGQMAGQIGSNATGMYGVQANAYGQAQNQENEFWGSLMGMGAQLGAAAIGKSDRRLKENVVAVGRDAGTGLTLYEFNYIGQPGRRFRGVMADEVEARFPDAVQYDDLGYASVNYLMLGMTMEEV